MLKYFQPKKIMKFEIWFEIIFSFKIAFKNQSW
jgi:hypothetical protein